MRSLAEQSTAEMGGRWSVLARQKADHVDLEAMLHELDEAPLQAQPELLNRIYRLVFPHAFAEESVLWPVLRRVLPDGERLTAIVEQEHQQINELVCELEELPLHDGDRPRVLAAIVELLREDVRDEEDTLLPRLQEALGPRELRRLGVAWEAVRRTAPTRPHPVVSRRPPGNVLSALPLSALDRTRDTLDRVSHRSGALAPRLSKISTVLGRGASAVEHLPAMRSGERAETTRPSAGP